MPDFSKSKVGDKCFHHTQGEVIIDEVREDCVRVVIGHVTTEFFTFTGRVEETDELPTLYHSRPEITDPSPPKRLVKKTLWQNWYHRILDNDDRTWTGGGIWNDKTIGERIANGDKWYIGTFSTEIEYEEE
jgi:hypothetical protein